MKIFVAYGYNERDKWIEEMIFPIIKAFGAEREHLNNRSKVRILE